MEGVSEWMDRKDDRWVDEWPDIGWMEAITT